MRSQDQVFSRKGLAFSLANPTIRWSCIMWSMAYRCIMILVLLETIFLLQCLILKITLHGIIKIHELYHVKIHQWLSQVASSVSGLYVKFCQKIMLRYVNCYGKESSTIILTIDQLNLSEPSKLVDVTYRYFSTIVDSWHKPLTFWQNLFV